MKPFTSQADIFMLPLDVSYRDWSGGWMPVPVDMDFMPETGMPTYIILRDDAPPIRFSGERKVRRSQSHNHLHMPGLWTALNIFKTPGGRFVCQDSFKLNEKDETATHCVEIFEDEQSAAAFMERSSVTFDGLLDRLAKRLAQAD